MAEATKGVSAALVALSKTVTEVEGGRNAIVDSCRVNLIMSSLFDHVEECLGKGWNGIEIDEEGARVDLKGLYPYWMSKGEAVRNDVKLDGQMALLTAPNMSGKSTVMRSVGAATLLAQCGLLAPVGKGSKVGSFDEIFVRGASSDVPAMGKSAFGAEMEDVKDMLEGCGQGSLVIVDELGRGTSPRDGTAIAAAVLEAMAEKKMTGFFSTHLHGVLELEKEMEEEVRERIRMMRMRADDDGKGSVDWTYNLEDGVCNDSMAIATARR